MRQIEPQVKWHISSRKLYFRFLMFQNGSKNQYLGFQQISRKSVKVEFLTYHVTRPCIHASDRTTSQVAYFEQKVIFSVSDVSERFKESISRFPANFKKISESRIFDLSRDPTSHRAKISLFQNMLGFIQYGSRLFGIDASSDLASVSR